MPGNHALSNARKLAKYKHMFIKHVNAYQYFTMLLAWSPSCADSSCIIKMSALGFMHWHILWMNGSRYVFSCSNLSMFHDDIWTFWYALSKMMCFQARMKRDSSNESMLNHIPDKTYRTILMPSSWCPRTHWGTHAECDSPMADRRTGPQIGGCPTRLVRTNTRKQSIWKLNFQPHTIYSIYNV